MKTHVAALLLGLAVARAQEPLPAPPEAPEDRYWRVETLPLPDGAAIEVGGMGFLSDGRLVVSTRRGQVWIVDGALSDDPRLARFSLYADGLCEGLGLQVLPGDRIFVLQRQELSELIDEDGDGRCDHVRCVSAAWGMSGNYHEFAFGLPVDRDGNFFVALNLGFFDPYWYLGRSNAEWRGWVLRIAPDGAVTGWASGFRSPNGISLSPDGELFVTDNQGDFVPSCPVHVVERGRHYGHPASLDWRDEYRATGRKADWYDPATDVPREPAAVWIPYDLSRSTGDLAWDTTAGKFGPFAGQPFAAEVTNGLVLRLSLEKVRGRWQGAAFAFRPGVGAANRVLFAPDGTLLCGLTSRGWGGEGASHGITRVRWTGETPLEMRSVALRQDGFDVALTRPLAQEVRPDQVHATQYRYRYWWKYGSPEDDVRTLGVRAVTASTDRRHLRIDLDDLRPGYVARVEFDGVVGEGGHALLHPRFDYSVGQLPLGDATDDQICHRVPAPRSREQLAGKAVYLSDLGLTMRTWRGEGWVLGSDPALAADDPTRLAFGESRHYLLRPTGSTEPLRSVFEFGDCTIRGEVMLARGASFGLVLPSGDRVDLPLGARDAGTWLPFEAVYREPRAGAPARLASLSLGGEDLLPAPRALLGLGARGPIGLVDTAGARAAFKNVLVAPDDLPTRDDGSFAGAGGWKLGIGDWRALDGALLSTDALSSAVRPLPEGTGDFAFEADFVMPPRFEAAVRVLCNELGIGGHEVRLNRSAPGKLKTGSLVGWVEVQNSLVAYDDTWFRLRVEVKRGPADTDRVRVLVDGVVAAEHDVPRSAAAGEFVSISRLVRKGRLEVRNPFLATEPR